MTVAVELLIQPLCCHSVETCQIAVEHDSFSTDNKNVPLEQVDSFGAGLFKVAICDFKLRKL
jgi:hypothetical protein